MALVIDASSPARAEGTVTTAVTTATFNPPPCILVACTSGTASSVANPTVAITNNGAAIPGGWTQIGLANDTTTSPASHGMAAIHIAVLGTGRTGMTVTSTQTNGGQPTNLWIYCITGADTTTPYTNATIGANNSSAVVTTNAFTSTRTDSLLLCSATEWALPAAGVPVSSDLTESAYYIASQCAGLSGYKTIPSSGTSSTASLDPPGTSAGAWKYVTSEILRALGPSIVNRSQGTTASGTTHSIATLPAGIATGDLLLCTFTHLNNSTASTASSGWTKLGQASSTTNVCSGTVFWKIAGASNTLSVTVGTASAGSYIVTALRDAGTPTGVSAVGNSTNSDPPANTPAGGSNDYFYLATRSGTGTVTPSAAPTSYTNLTNQVSVAPSTSTAERPLTGTTDNPAVFTVATAGWVCWTIAVPKAVTGPADIPATATITATPSLSTTGIKEAVSAANITATPSLSTTASAPQKIATATITATPSVTATGVAQAVSAANIVATASVIATGITPLILNNNFEGGSNGTTLTTGNSGGTSGTAFDVIQRQAAATVAFDSAIKAHGTLGLKLQVAGTAGAGAAVQWTTALGGTQPTLYARFYFYATANPVTFARRLVTFATATPTVVSALHLLTNGKLELSDGATAPVLTTVGSIALNAWNRIEVMVVGSPTAGHVEMRLFNGANLESTTPSETALVSSSVLNTTGPTAILEFGSQFGVRVNTGPFYYDDLGVSNSDWLGSVVTVSDIPGTATITATPSLSASGVIEKPATATLTVTPSISVGGVVEKSATASIVATPSLSTTGIKVGISSANLVATPSVVAPAVIGIPAAASLVATPSVSATGIKVAISSAAIVATPSVSATGVIEKLATATLIATPSVSATAIKLGISTANIVATPSVSATGTVGIAQAATATLIATPIVSASSAAAIAATATLTATVSVSSTGVVVKVATASLIATASVSATAFADYFATVSVVATASVSATAVVFIAQAATATLTATVSVSSTGIVVKLATATLVAIPSLVAPAVIEKLATASIVVTTSVSATGVRILIASANIVATPSLTATGVIEKLVSAALVATASISATGIVIKITTANIVATPSISATAFVIWSVSANLVVTANIAIEVLGSNIGAATLIASVSVSATGIRILVASAAIVASPNIVVTALAISVASVALAVVVSISATGVIERPVTAALIVVGSLVVSGIVAKVGVATLIIAVSISASGIIPATVSAVMIAVVGVSAAGRAILLGNAASLVIAATLSASGGGAQLATVLILSTAILTAVGIREVLTSANIVATASVSATGVIGKIAVANLIATPSITGVGLAIRLATVTINADVQLYVSASFTTLGAVSLNVVITMFGSIFFVSFTLPLSVSLDTSGRRSRVKLIDTQGLVARGGIHSKVTSPTYSVQVT